MRILIVEDEALIAQRIERLTREILGRQLRQLSIQPTLERARYHLTTYPVDLLLLDLNLNGKNGFELLEYAVAGAFHTCIVSAYTEKAVQAFEYGVLDFIPKPFNKQRLQKAFTRFVNAEQRAVYPTKYLAIRKNKKLQLIDIEEIIFLKGAGNYTELHLQNQSVELHDKSLGQLQQLLPPHFERTHKSYIVNLKMVHSISKQYEIVLNDGIKIPISRTAYKQLKNRLN